MAKPPTDVMRVDPDFKKLVESIRKEVMDTKGYDLSAPDITRGMARKYKKRVGVGLDNLGSLMDV